MKWITLICLFGLGTATLTNLPAGNLISGFQAGKTLTFKYAGRIVNGLPELSKQYTGVAYECDVIVDVESSSKMFLRVENFKQGNIFDKLDNPGTKTDYNWRTVLIKQVEPVTSEMVNGLSEGMELSILPNGEISTVRVSKDDNLASINFKKALAVLIQTKTRSTFPTEGAVMTNRLFRGEFNVQRDLSGFWKVQESSLEGICETQYQVNDVPKHIAKEYATDKTLVPEHEKELCLGTGKKMVEIIKTRNVNNCIKRNVYNTVKPGHIECKHPGCLDQHSRTSVTRYVGCGTENGVSSNSADFKIVSIVQESEILSSLVGAKSEKFLTGVKQALTLKSTLSRSGSSGLRQSNRLGDELNEHNSITLSGLLFEYSPDLQKVNGIFPNLDMTRFEVTGNVRTLIFDNKTLERKLQGKIYPETKHLIIKLVVEDLVRHEKLAEKQIPLKTLNVAKALGMMKKDMIMKLYKEVRGQVPEDRKKIVDNVIFDCLMMSGSTDSYLVLKEMIVKGRMSSVQMFTLFTFMPTNVLTPTEHLLSEYFELIGQPVLKKKPFIQKQCMFSVMKMVNSACLSDWRKSHFPTDIYGDFCNPNSTVVVSKIFPFLQSMIQNAQSEEALNTAVVATSLLEHKNVLTVLLPVLEQKHESATHLSRWLAIGSLNGLAMKHPELVIPIFDSIFHNHAEKSEIRLAALQLLLQSRPNMHILHKMALRTYNETNDEILKVVNVAFASLKNDNTRPMLQKTAQLLYPFIKKTEGIMPTSGLKFYGDNLKDFGFSYSGFASWLNSKDSVIPQTLMSSNIKKFAQLRTPEYFVGMRQTGISKLIEIISRTLKSSKMSSGGIEDLEEKIRNGLSEEWRKVIEELKILDREDISEQEGVSIAVLVDLFSSTPIYKDLRVSTGKIRDVVRQILTDPELLKKFFDFTYKLTFERMINLSPMEVLIPSDMGLPSLIEMNTPVVLTGMGKITGEKEHGSPVPKFSLEMLGFINWQQYTTITTFNYNTNEDLITGVDEHGLLYLPADIKMKVEPVNQEIEIKTQWLPKERLPKEIDLVHIHTRPFIGKINSYSVMPVTVSGHKDFRVMKSNCDLSESVIKVGESIGLNLKTIMNTESCYPNMRGVYQILKMMNYNPMNLIHFGSMNAALTERMTPSVRRHLIRIQFSPEESSTKGFIFKLKAGVASKKLGEQMKYHWVVRDDQKPGKLSSWPYKVMTKNLEDATVQNSRRQLLKDVMYHIENEQGSALVLKMSIATIGQSRPRTWSYSMAMAKGKVGFEDKWNMKLQNDDGTKVLCIKGEHKMPPLPILSLSELRSTVVASRSTVGYSYINEIGYGSSCTDSQIKIIGTGKTSEKQIESSNNSPEAKILEELRQKGISKSLVELSDAADQLRKQLMVVDQLDYKIKFHNVNKYAVTYTDFVYYLMKTLSFFNMDGSHNSERLSESLSGLVRGDRVDGAIEYHLNFNTEKKTVDITMKGVEGIFKEKYPMVIAKYLHLPRFLQFVLPPRAQNQDLIKTVVNKVTGRPLYPVCKQEGNVIQTFDNVTGQIELDDCYHLLAADCSIDKSIGILIRSLGDAEKSRIGRTGSSKELKVMIGKSVIKISPVGPGSRGISVFVDGVQQGSNTVAGSVPLKGKDGENLGVLTGAIDGIMFVAKNGVAIKFDGGKTVVESPIGKLKNKMCGLCGDNNNEKTVDLTSPEKCVFSKNVVLAASYRLPSLPIGPARRSCSPLKRHLELELIKEKEQCTKHIHGSSKSLMTSFIQESGIQEREGQGHGIGGGHGIARGSGECMVMMHEIYVRPSQLCFSKVPVRDCREGCKPEQGAGKVNKKVPFTCLDKRQRMTEHIDRKVRSGQIVQELRNMHTSLHINLELPRGSCVSSRSL